MDNSKKDPFIVSDQTCKGCYYYGYLSGVACKDCEYTCITGKLRPAGETPANCSVKLVRRRLHRKMRQELYSNRIKAIGGKKA